MKIVFNGTKKAVFNALLVKNRLNGWGREIFLLIFAKQILKFKSMLCKYLRSSLKTVHRTVFSPGGVALSSNLSSTASQVKQKEQAEACSFCLAGVERFELPDDGVRVRSLTAWRYPNTRRVALASYLAKTIQPLYNTRLFVFLQVF